MPRHLSNHPPTLENAILQPDRLTQLDGANLISLDNGVMLANLRSSA